MKDDLDGKIMREFASLQPKTYSYLIDDGNENKKNKSYKRVCHKTKTESWRF